MKKILSILLIAAMLISMLSIMPLSVVAEPVGNPVSDAAGFAAMSADGQYYLTADITVSATYATIFTGTLDGNGKTITTTVPLFKDVRGTIKNLTVGGTIDYSTKDSHAGAVAAEATGATFTNVTNNATITGHPGRSKALGGIVGRVGVGDCTFTNVSNTGNISGHNVGGIVGAFAGGNYSTTFTGCTNSGAILYTDDGTLSSKTNPKNGGIIGAADGASMTISNCLNTGNITGGDGDFSGAGGIVGYSTVPASGLTISNCINRGNVQSDIVAGGIIGLAYNALTVENCLNDSTATIGPNAGVTTGFYGGGIVGKAGNGSIATSYFRNCVNKGTVQSNKEKNGCGGIVARLRNTGYFENCYNEGAVTALHYAGGIVGVNEGYSADYMNCINYGNITASDTGIYKAHAKAGGIVGYTKNENKDAGQMNKFYYCGNEGTIDSTYHAAGIIAQFDPCVADTEEVLAYTTKTVEIKYCYNTGDIIGNKTSSGGFAAGLASDIENNAKCGVNLICQYNYVGGTLTSIDESRPTYATAFTKSAFDATDFHHNYVVNGMADSLYRDANNTSGLDFPAEYDYYYVGADLTSGKLMNDINSAAPSNVFYQVIGMDAHPTTLAFTDIKTGAGAAVRLDNPTGLRFSGAVLIAYLDSLQAENVGADITYGMIIAPTAYVTAAGEFTIEALDAAEMTYNEVEAISVENVNKGTAETNGYYKFNCVLSNVKDTNYQNEFSAITYIKIVDGANTRYIYAQTSTSRSIDYVAEAALDDLSDTKTGGYQNAVAQGEITRYSPYTEAQRGILAGFTTGA